MQRVHAVVPSLADNICCTLMSRRIWEFTAAFAGVKQQVYSIVNQKPALLLSCGCIKAKQRHKGRGIAQTRQACEGTAYTCLRNVSKGMVPNQSKLFNRTGSGMPCSPLCDSNRCSRACMLCTLCSMLSSESMGRSALLPVCKKTCTLAEDCNIRS